VESPPPPEHPGSPAVAAGGIADPGRLAEVRDCGLLGTGAEEPFDRLTRLASAVLDAPLAFVTIVDDTGCYWKSHVGGGPPGGHGRVQPVEESFSQLVVATGAPVVIDDVAHDPRVRDCPSLRRSGVAAWAGYPVHGPEGHVLGGFGVGDSRARHWTARDTVVLETLSQAISREILLRHVAVRAMTLARTLQASLLPPAIPDLPGLAVSARYRPAGDGTGVLGDFFDVFHTGRTSLAAVLGDVAGKGIEAAKVTALAHYTIRAAASRDPDPAAILAQLNTALLTQHPDSERFLTAVYLAIRESRTGMTVTVCNAGHTPVLLRRENGTVTSVGEHGVVLGLFDDAALTTTRVRLRAGDTLLLYTDGVTEARRGREQYGDDRLRALLAATDGPTNVDGLTATIESAALAWSDGPPRDDIAILAINLPPP
jgi:phosphoserine phosphatase RsbU/P